MTDEKVMSKVRALLNLAERAGTDEEAQLARERATELMLRYSIDEAPADDIVSADAYIDYCIGACNNAVTPYVDETCGCCGRKWGYDTREDGTTPVCRGKHVEGAVWARIVDEGNGN